MTATPKLQPKPIRKVTVNKQKDFTHKEPVIIPSHLDDIPLISAASYIKDARNRWYIHNHEVMELWDAHVNIFNIVRPHVVSAHTTVVDKIKDVTNG